MNTPIILPMYGGDEDDSLPMGLAPYFTHTSNQRVDFRTREVYLTGEIAEGDGDWFVMAIRELERLGGDAPIRVLMSTPGGSVDDMFAIHDAVRATPCPVEVLAYGQVCSAGVLLLACCDRRLVTHSLAVMSHESSGAEEADLGFRASRDRFRFREWQHRYWGELMGRYTPETAAWWMRKTERQAEFWLLGGQAVVDAGLADLVVDTWPLGTPEEIVKRQFLDTSASESTSMEVQGES